MSQQGEQRSFCTPVESKANSLRKNIPLLCYGSAFCSSSCTTRAPGLFLAISFTTHGPCFLHGCSPCEGHSCTFHLLALVFLPGNFAKSSSLHHLPRSRLHSHKAGMGKAEAIIKYSAKFWRGALKRENHRIPGGFRLEGTLKMIQFHLLYHGQGHFPLDF